MDRISRKDLKTDKFAEEVTHTVEYLSEHKKALLRWGGAAVAIVVIAVAVWAWRNYAKAQRQEELVQALRIQAANIGPPTGNPFLLSYPTAAEKEAAAKKAFSDIIAKHPGTEEAYVARFYLGVIAADAGRIQEAQKAFEDVMANAKAPMASVAKLALAQLLQAQNKLPEAEKLLRELMQKPTELVSKEQATIALARVLAETNPGEARKLLEPLRTARGPVSRAALNALAELSTR